MGYPPLSFMEKVHPSNIKKGDIIKIVDKVSREIIAVVEMKDIYEQDDKHWLGASIRIIKKGYWYKYTSSIYGRRIKNLYYIIWDYYRYKDMDDMMVDLL